MAIGSKDRPPMLVTRKYAQWKSPVSAKDDSPPVPERTAVEAILNMSPKNKKHYQSEKEIIHLLLTKIRDEIYSTVDACKIAHDMWIDIERLQQGKEIAKQITHLSESASEEDSDPEQAQRDKDMQKNLTLIVKYFKKIKKPTNNNLRTSSNSKNDNMDTSPRYKNDNQTGQFGNQRTVTVAGARETVGSQETKKGQDYTYHKKNMLLYKQAEKYVPLQAEQAHSLEDTNKEIDKQELEAHYSYVVKIQEVPTVDLGTHTEPLEKVQYDAEYNVFANTRQHYEQPESINNTCVVEMVDCNVIPDSLDMCDNDIQTDQNVEECDDERVALANLIANLKLDIDENKKDSKAIKESKHIIDSRIKRMEIQSRGV
uniref:Gag-Pol polyprotein n=1 Tax=Tanacetum cinerariifolium TaxID=118510 RepID=A0A6L2P634_TANCI|nr:hypothetical protein [Tanacetum cinerariifolium]